VFSAVGLKSGTEFSLENQANSGGVRDPFQAPTSIWANYTPAKYTVPFVNGSGATPSKITYSNTVIGNGASGPLRATGTLTVTRIGGTLLTLK
jgi:hypothetical protein